MVSKSATFLLEAPSTLPNLPQSPLGLTITRYHWKKRDRQKKVIALEQESRRRIERLTETQEVERGEKSEIGAQEWGDGR